MIFCVSAVTVVISPFSFLILLIWALSLFFLMTLAKYLSILFIFSKNQLLVLLISAIVFFVSISFIFVLIVMISFLLLTLGFPCSSFSTCFRCKVRLFEIFLVSWGELELLWTSLLELLLPHPLGFESSFFRCHLFLGIFWFPLWFLQWSLGYLAAQCLASMYLCFSQFFSHYCYLVS